MSGKKSKKAEKTVGESVVTEQTPVESSKNGGHPVRKLALLSLIAGIAALASSSGARKTVLDVLFGAEEEFQYTSHVGGPANGNGSA